MLHRGPPLLPRPSTSHRAHILLPSRPLSRRAPKRTELPLGGTLLRSPMTRAPAFVSPPPEHVLRSAAESDVSALHKELLFGAPFRSGQALFSNGLRSLSTFLGRRRAAAPACSFRLKKTRLSLTTGTPFRVAHSVSSGGSHPCQEGDGFLTKPTREVKSVLARRGRRGAACVGNDSRTDLAPRRRRRADGAWLQKTRR